MGKPLAFTSWAVDDLTCLCFQLRGLGRAGHGEWRGWLLLTPRRDGSVHRADGAPEPHRPALLGLPNQRAMRTGAETATFIFSTSGTRKSKTQEWTGLASCEASLLAWQVVDVRARGSVWMSGSSPARTPLILGEATSMISFHLNNFPKALVSKHNRVVAHGG